MIIKLPIYYIGDETDSDKLGITEVPRVVRTQTFYEITSIVASSDGSETVLHSGGETFICAYPIEKVEKIIEDSTNKYILQKLYN